MVFFIQVDKESKRVTGYSSTRSNIDTNLEIEVDDSNKDLEELFNNPFIYVFNESTNTFSKDTEYQEKLIKEKNNRISDAEKIENLTKQLADQKLESMKKDLTINMLIKQQAQNKIEIMKMKGSN